MKFSFKIAATVMLACFFCLQSVRAQDHISINKTIRGKVVDSLTKVPLSGVAIQLVKDDVQERKVILKSNSLGAFEFTILRQGNYTLQLFMLGYNEYHRNFTLSTIGDEVLVQLTPTPVLTRSIRGRVIDSETKFPLKEAHIIFQYDTIWYGTTTDAAGYFRFERAPLGRHLIKISHVGYKAFQLNISISSPHEPVLDIALEESPEQLLDSIVIIGKAFPENGINENGVLANPFGSHSINPVEVIRRPGTWGETIREIAPMAGNQTADDSRNDIVVRGNSPGSVLWRLEGINVPNPNHFSIPGTAGGPVTMINDRMLGNSAFYVGAFPVGLGNTISGIYDIHFREGDSLYHKSIQFGVLGLEGAMEGPINRKHGSSFLTTARIGSLSLFQKLGVDFGINSPPRYSDLSFKLNFPGKGKSSVSIFGLAGMSSIDILISEDLANFYGERDRNQYFNSSTGIIGATYKSTLNENAYLSVGVAASGQWTTANHDLVYPPDLRNEILAFDNLNNSDTLPPILFYDFKERRLSGTVFYTHKIKSQGNTSQSISIGLNTDLYFLNYFDSSRYLFDDPSDFRVWRTRWESKASSLLLQPYAQWKFANSGMDFSIGIHSQYFTLSKSYSPLEPRVGFRYFLEHRQNVTIGFGLHSQMQSPYLYFYGTTNDVQGHPIPINKEMDFTRSLNSTIGYERFLGPTQRPVRIKSELFYQYIYNVPVEKQPSSFSLLNAGATFTRFYPDTLVNAGEGENYGLEVTVDRNFAKHYLFMINGSLFQSKYMGSDKTKRNTTFNGNYILNALGTYEWETPNQNVLSVGLRVSTSGGRRHGVVDEAESESKKHVVYIEGTENKLQFKPYFKVDFRINYRINFKKASHEVVLDIINILNTRNVLRHSYIPAYETGEIGRVEEEYQLGLLPFFYYRVQF